MVERSQSQIVAVADVVGDVASSTVSSDRLNE